MKDIEKDCTDPAGSPDVKRGGGPTGTAALARTAAPLALPGFRAVPVSKDDTVVIPEGYKVEVLAPRGTPITGDRRAAGSVCGEVEGPQGLRRRRSGN
jgi:hypothetical protein